MSQPVRQETANDLLRAEYVDDDVVIQWVSAQYGPTVAANSFNLDDWRDRYYAARTALERADGPTADEPKPCPACDPSVGFVCEAHGLHEYAFDLDLICSLRFNAPSHEAALLTLRDTLECAGANLGAWENGKPILSEVSLRGTPFLYDTDDPATHAEAEAPVVFEPWTNDLRAALHLAVEAFEGEEDSVQAEHKHLIAALNAVLAGSENGGINRHKVVEAHLRMAMCKTPPDDDDQTFLAWVADMACLPDDCQLKTLANEYLQLVHQPKAA